MKTENEGEDQGSTIRIETGNPREQHPLEEYGRNTCSNSSLASQIPEERTGDKMNMDSGRFHYRRCRPTSLKLSILMMLLLMALSSNSFRQGRFQAIRVLGAQGADDDGNGGDDDGADDGNADDGDDNDDGNGADDGGEEIADKDDDLFQWDENLSFDDVSVMPVSCVNYNNGHVILFELFESSSSYQCHFKTLGTFIVSIAHYMRAYFNYQALVNGRNFQLPGDAGFLNCVMLQETAYSDYPLYAKIGCMERQSFTSTKLQLHVYYDKQCSIPYDDGHSSRKHATSGYEINGYYFNSKVSFRPQFYSCQNCKPSSVSDSFNKRNSYWYDDDYISQQGKRRDDDDAADDGGGGDDAADDVYADDQNYGQDDYFSANDDINYANNDDGGGDDDDNNGGGGDDAADDGGGDDANDDGGDDGNGDDADDADDNWRNGNGNKHNGEGYWDDDDDYYTADDDSSDDGAGDAGRRRLAGPLKTFTAAPGVLKKFEQDFWQEYELTTRRLDDNSYGIGDWNMCHQIYKYGLWCDDECREVNYLRMDEWSSSDIFLLVIMCIFMAAMMLLVFAKRVKAYEKASLYGDELDVAHPGLPPMAMVLLFILIMTIIVGLATLKFVNQTLVFAVVTCVLLFIYMLKLTLFESRTQPLLTGQRGMAVVDNYSLHSNMFA